MGDTNRKAHAKPQTVKSGGRGSAEALADASTVNLWCGLRNQFDMEIVTALFDTASKSLGASGNHAT